MLAKVFRIQKASQTLNPFNQNTIGQAFDFCLCLFEDKSVCLQPLPLDLFALVLKKLKQHVKVCPTNIFAFLNLILNTKAKA